MDPLHKRPPQLLHALELRSDVKLSLIRSKLDSISTQLGPLLALYVPRETDCGSVMGRENSIIDGTQ